MRLLLKSLQEAFSALPGNCFLPKDWSQPFRLLLRSERSRSSKSAVQAQRCRHPVEALRIRSVVSCTRATEYVRDHAIALPKFRPIISAPIFQRNSRIMCPPPHSPRHPSLSTPEEDRGSNPGLPGTSAAANLQQFSAQ